MKKIWMIGLLAMALIPLSGCHFNHHHRQGYHRDRYGDSYRRVPDRYHRYGGYRHHRHRHYD